ncbi:MAG: nitroreductase family protein [Muribaculaceae bacterium]|nr:nitroreductase family protein [Muribaculaceae bacterium]
MIPDINKIFASRATVRDFDASRNVSDELLDELINAAAHAPNTGNMQLYSVVVTRGEELKNELAGLHFNQPAAKNCNVLLTFCADTARFDSWCRASETASGLNNFGGAVTAIVDTAIFAQQFAQLAELNGLGTCFLGTATYSAKGFIEKLGLPEGVFPVLGLAVGYPANKGEASDRLPVEAIRHNETFGPYNEENIRRWYSEKENLPESKKFLEINNKKTLAQIYAEIRYPEPLNKALGDNLLDIMNK